MRICPGSTTVPVCTAPLLGTRPSRPIRVAAQSRSNFRLESRVFGHAGVAQLVEQRIRNAKVGGSTPLTGTKNQHQDQGLGFCQALFHFGPWAASAAHAALAALAALAAQVHTRLPSVSSAPKRHHHVGRIKPKVPCHNPLGFGSSTSATQRYGKLSITPPMRSSQLCPSGRPHQRLRLCWQRIVAVEVCA